MAGEHDTLVQQYQAYKDEVADYDKKMYAYTTQIEKYAEDVIAQISELRSAGVDLSVLKKYAKEDGTIDLTDAGVVKGMIEDLYALYKDTVAEGMKLLAER